MRSRKGFFARLLDLWRGIWGVKITDAEVRHAEAVYHRAIEERQDQYRKLKDAVGRLIYLRNRLEGDLQKRQHDLALVERHLLSVASSVDDTTGLALVRKKRTLSTEIERLETELQRVRSQAESAKEGLAQVKASVARLREERTQMLARKAHAMARLQVSETLAAANGEYHVTDEALENVREAIHRLEVQADLGGDEDLLSAGEISIAELRQNAVDEADMMELQVLRNRKALKEPEPREKLFSDEAESEPIVTKSAEAV